MTGNALHADVIRIHHNLLTGFFTGSPPCEWCGQPLPNHPWADLDEDGSVVTCPNRRPDYGGDR